ncbi:2-dehydropantoate 2-reductase [Candidatus Riesia pediculicola]|uniref:2-dehydropantoate 2-reductase n=1 Tax=Riesia pediculicola (strain USDA) TaxID=515618 RepID=D4G927_RIEPU|nr:2-dehydropantoate 2-reductase [Candidatus Riesia pediculicola]ADD79955.1 2-dehydropantoate 2-reductase [Candidatus Riesia pediculicola USDA]ARC53554.1 hypothetical protein AOE55_00040 [Candidatus Riesia pediculicola]
MKDLRNDPIKITVLGCGCIGKLWLSSLASTKHFVQGWTKEKIHKTLKFKIKSIDGRKHHISVPINNRRKLRESHLLIVTLKAWQVSKEISKVICDLNDHCILLLIHNGMGVLEELPKKIKQPIIEGNTTHASHYQNDYVKHVAWGETCIGPANRKAKKFPMIASTLNQIFPKVIWCKNIRFFNWKKLAINCSINPLSSIYRCQNGKLLKLATHQINRICQEVSSIMKREGFSEIDARSLFRSTIDVIDSTSKNFSSMYQDLLNRKKSEIDYINGYVIKRAKHFQIKVPENELLFSQIKKLEKKSEQSSR